MKGTVTSSQTQPLWRGNTPSRVAQRLAARSEDAGEETEPTDEIAALLAAGPLAARDLLLRRTREVSPCTVLVVVSKTPTDPDLKLALESGATGFLSRPALNDAVRHAIERGRLLASPASRP